MRNKVAALRAEITKQIDENPRLNSLTDSGNAERFAAAAEDELLWCDAGHWWHWDGRRWERKPTESVAQRIAKRVIAGLYRDASRADDELQEKLGKFALKSQSAGKRAAMVRLAKSEPGMEVSADEFNRDPWLLNVENGTIDLRTGEIREHSWEDRITKLCPVTYDPDARAPRFERFLQDVFGGDEELIGYLQRLAGYALTGEVREHLIAFWWGGGRNGKTTLIEVLRAIAGEYAFAGSMDLIVSKRGARLDNLAATNLADLHGRRLVTVEEVPQGARLDENLVKNVTGAGEINACRKFENPFTFCPTHKLIVATNYRPRIVGTDEGIWRRIHLLPFTQEFLLPQEAEEMGLDVDNLPPGKRKADPDMKRVLIEDEAPGILTWLVRGARSWAEVGTAPPTGVRDAVRSYRSSEDALGQFFEESCLVDPSREDLRVRSSELQEALKEFSDETGGRAPNNNDLAERLQKLGCEKCRIGRKGHRGWKGVGLLSDRHAGDRVDGEDS